MKLIPFMLLVTVVFSCRPTDIEPQTPQAIIPRIDIINLDKQKHNIRNNTSFYDFFVENENIYLAYAGTNGFLEIMDLKEDSIVQQRPLTLNKLMSLSVTTSDNYSLLYEDSIVYNDNGMIKRSEEFSVKEEAGGGFPHHERGIINTTFSKVPFVIEYNRLEKNSESKWSPYTLFQSNLNPIPYLPPKIYQGKNYGMSVYYKTFSDSFLITSYIYDHQVYIYNLLTNRGKKVEVKHPNDLFRIATNSSADKFQEMNSITRYVLNEGRYTHCYLDKNSQELIRICKLKTPFKGRNGKKSTFADFQFSIVVSDLMGNLKRHYTLPKGWYTGAGFTYLNGKIYCLKSNYNYFTNDSDDTELSIHIIHI